MQQKTQRRVACCHDSRYKPCAELGRCLFGSLELAVAALTFAEHFHAKQAKNLPQQQG
jgi:hypothetical protein